MTAQPAGKLITVAGIDGAGKSTLAAALHGALKDAGHDAVLIGKHTTEVPADAALSAYLDSLNAIVYRRDQAVGAACGDHYWLFALAAWYSLQDRLVIQPALQAGTHVILDNAHHKITRPVRGQPRRARRTRPAGLRPPHARRPRPVPPGHPRGGAAPQGRVHPAGGRANRQQRRGVRQLPGRRQRPACASRPGKRAGNPST